MGWTSRQAKYQTGEWGASLDSSIPALLPAHAVSMTIVRSPSPASSQPRSSHADTAQQVNTLAPLVEIANRNGIVDIGQYPRINRQVTPRERDRRGRHGIPAAHSARSARTRCKTARRADATRAVQRDVLDPEEGTPRP